MFKKLIAIPLILVVLTGCSSLTEEEREERAGYKKWSSDVYEHKNFDYNENIEIEENANKYLKPTLDVIAETIPDGRAGVDLEVFKNENWFRDLCNNYVDETQELIVAPLSAPVVGVSDRIEVAGYMSAEQFEQLAAALKTELVTSEGDGFILEGSSVEYPYTVTKYSITVENDFFKTVIVGDTAWNALVWEEYYTVDDPGLFSQKKHALPSEEYMPVTITSYYKPSCEVKK